MFSFNNINFHIVTFGCQMNKHDSERICGMLENLGANQVKEIKDSDIVIYLTCCVREAADLRLYGQAASIKNIPLRDKSTLNHRIIAIGGCIGQRDGKKILSIVKNIDIVFGTHNIHNLTKLIEKSIIGDEKIVEIQDRSSRFPTELPTKREKFYHAWLPITIGCNNFCSYCIVPYVRGREKSRCIEDIIKEAYTYKKEGVKEICLLGQNVNSYGRDLYGNTRFYDLLVEIDKIGFDRLRFATSHPKDLSENVINAFGSLNSLQPSLHLPVQSGSDKILKSMNRHYSSSDYLTLIEKLRHACPEIALSTDVIVGFPGEEEKDFEQTYNLINTVGYTQVYSFIYSKRNGTPAAKMTDQIDPIIVKKRFNRLLDVIAKRAYEQNQKDSNKIINVLIEGPSKKNKQILVGKSPKNQTVHIPIECDSHKNFVGKIIPAKVIKAKTWYLIAKFI